MKIKTKKSTGRLDLQPFEGVWCAKERGRTKRLEIDPTPPAAAFKWNHCGR